MVCGFPKGTSLETQVSTDTQRATLSMSIALSHSVCLIPHLVKANTLKLLHHLLQSCMIKRGCWEESKEAMTGETVSDCKTPSFP